jgi:hypothetical protein
VSVGALAASLEQVPTWPARLHRINGSVQAVSQQTPVTQKPVPHCDGVAQAPPWGTGVAVGVEVTVGVLVGVAVIVTVAVTVAVAVMVGVGAVHTLLTQDPPGMITLALTNGGVHDVDSKAVHT